MPVVSRLTGRGWKERKGKTGRANKNYLRSRFKYFTAAIIHKVGVGVGSYSKEDIRKYGRAKRHSPGMGTSMASHLSEPLLSISIWRGTTKSTEKVSCRILTIPSAYYIVVLIVGFLLLFQPKFLSWRNSRIVCLPRTCTRQRTSGHGLERYYLNIIASLPQLPRFSDKNIINSNYSSKKLCYHVLIITLTKLSFISF